MLSNTLSKERVKLGSKDDVLPSLDALKWLTLRICIHNDLAEFLIQEVRNKKTTSNCHNPDASQASPNESISRAQQIKEKKAQQDLQRKKFTLISLQWHCALLDNFNVKTLAEKFNLLFEAKFSNSMEIDKIQVLEFFKTYLNEIFPHISTKVVTSHQRWCST